MFPLTAPHIGAPLSRLRAARRRLHRFPIYSLGSKLLVFSLALVIVPGAIFAFIAIVNARHAVEKAVSQQLTQAAHDAAEVVAAALAEQSRAVRTWAHQEVMRDLTTGDPHGRVTRFLIALKADNPAYLDLLGADERGRVVAATDPALLGKDESGERWVGSALGGKRVLAGPNWMPAYGRSAIELAAPVRNSAGAARIIGALLGIYDWERGVPGATRMRDTLARLGVHADILILDAQDTVIGGSRGAVLDALRGRNLRKAGWEAAPATARQTFAIAPHSQVLIGHARFNRIRPRWAVVVMQPLEEALLPVQRMQNQLMLALAAVLIGGAGLAWWLGGRMVRPLRALTRATEEFGRSGQPPGPVRAHTRDEIGRLAHAFNRMSQELKHAQDNLVDTAKFAFAGELAAGIAHEVRTPLSVLRSSAQILRRSAGGDPRSQELVTMIISEVDRIDRVVAGLIEVARPRPPRIEPTALEPLLLRVLHFVASQAQEKRISIRRAFAADLPPALCDAEEIYQVALNLIVNALQILPEGGEITVRTIAGSNARVGFEVSDNGPGLPPEMQARIFAPFFTAREGGTGLGLACAQRVVQAHHGSIGVHSEIGRGATFRVELPGAGSKS